MRSSILLGLTACALVPACRNDDSDGDPWVGGMTAADDGSGDDGGDDGGPCSLQPSDPPLTLGDAAGDAPDVVLGLAIAGGTTVACGDGFVALPDGDSADLDGRCTGIATVDDNTVVVVTDSGSIALVGVDGPSVASTADAGGAAYGVASDGETIAVAIGSGGVMTFDAELGGGSTLTSSVDARAIASTGDGWLVGGEGHATFVSADGTPGTPHELPGTVSDVAVADGVGVLAREAFGVELVEVGSSLDSKAVISTEGTALDVDIAGDTVLVATGAAVHRYDLSDGVLMGRAPRPDVATLRGDWITAVAADGARGVAGIGAGVTELQLGDGSGSAVALLPRTTTSVFADGDSEVIVLVRNGGNEDMYVGDIELAGSTLEIDSIDADEREGCEGQYAVPAGGSMLITLAGSAGDEEIVELSMKTSDPNNSTLPLPVEINRPSLAVGDPAPEFSMLTFDGQLVDLSKMSGELVYLKLFSYS